MIYTPPWLEIARRDMQRGILEIAGRKHHPRILEYHDRTSLDASTDEVPWCASAVCCWLEESDRSSTGSARARSFLKWGTRLSEPAFGCITIIKRGGRNQPGPDVINAMGHVAIFIDMNTPTEMTLLGGNQGDRVCERSYSLDRLLGWRWPGAAV